MNAAAPLCGATFQAFYLVRNKDQKFAEEWDKAKLVGAKAYLMELETEADRRAVEGTEEPVFYQGDECGRIRRYSDRLLTLRIKATAKRAGDDSYVERSDITSQGEQVQAGVIVIGQASKDDDEWHAKHAKS
ncbi:MAG: hypothetical protein ACR2Q4_08340 [Geminicoccaceae bacterium]